MKTITGTIRVLAVCALLTAMNALGAAAGNSAEQVRGKAVFPFPFMSVGEPTEGESAALLEAANVFDSDGARAGMAALERFLAAHPQSAWAASVRVGMAQFYQAQCRFSLALEHYELAWARTCTDKDPAAQELAAVAGAGWGYLLGCLGQQEPLENLLAMVDAVQLPLGKYTGGFAIARTQLVLLKKRAPGANRCGLAAMNILAKDQQLDAKLKRWLIQIPVPANGFSAADLIAVGQTNGVPLEAVPAACGRGVAAALHFSFQSRALCDHSREAGRLLPGQRSYLWRTALDGC